MENNKTPAEIEAENKKAAEHQAAADAQAKRDEEAKAKTEPAKVVVHPFTKLVVGKKYLYHVGNAKTGFAAVVTPNGEVRFKDHKHSLPVSSLPKEGIFELEQ